MENNTWTPIYSGTTKKLIAGVRNNIIYGFVETPDSRDGGLWVQIGCIEKENVFSFMGSSKQLIGEIYNKNNKDYYFQNTKEKPSRGSYQLRLLGIFFIV